MTTEREELTAIIDDRWHGYGYHPQGAADAIIAAGYSKHHEELAKYKRGAKTLGEIIEKQSREVLEVTGLHHLINEYGDGHWDAVWMRLHEMRDELASLKESTIGRERLRGDSWRDRAQAIEASHDEAIRQAKQEAFEQGQKSGIRHADRRWAASEMMRPDLPGPLSPNPYRKDAK